jgi:hypothetical protein
MLRQGRPLWAAKSGEWYASAKAMSMLIGGKEKWTDIPESERESASLAILAARTNLLSNHVIVNYARSSHLVARHMANKFRYCSEPLLAEAAAHFMSNHTILRQILASLSDLILTKASTIMAQGMICKLVAQIIMLIAKDKAAFLKYGSDEKLGDVLHSLPITVKEYLSALLGTDNYNTHLGSKLDSDIQDAVISFSNFIQKLDILQAGEEYGKKMPKQRNRGNLFSIIFSTNKNIYI